MNLAINKMSALRILRAIRSTKRQLSEQHIDLLAPSPSPRRRWSSEGLPLDRLALESPPSREHPIYVAVPNKASRLQASFASCTTYSTGLPENSFRDIGDGISIPCPELLFLEMAQSMSPAVHALLGYELCGSFSRAPQNPRTGATTFGIKPVTTVKKIREFLDSCRNVRGLENARRTLGAIADNAWSPMEALLAAMAALPENELGYELGSVKLNTRYDSAPELVSLGCRASRVPDIEIEGTSVGFNYDGHEHFDLSTLASASSDDERAAAMRSIRRKYVDDLRRNRELAARGLVVMPVTSEDLFAESGLDAVMLEAAFAIECLNDRDMGHVRSLVASKTLRRARQRLIWSLLPWDASLEWAHDIIERERPKAIEVIDVDLTV